VSAGIVVPESISPFSAEERVMHGVNKDKLKQLIGVLVSK
jgi:hypothetical protein